MFCKIKAGKQSGFQIGLDLVASQKIYKSTAHILSDRQQICQQDFLGYNNTNPAAAGGV
jgi:hypothetical protein